MTDKKLRRYFVSYDLVSAGVVEIEAFSADEAMEIVREMDVKELESNVNGCDLLDESINASDEGEA